jgi:hypothetical protein
MADKKSKSKTKDPYLERNEFKKGFYDQPDKPPVTDDTMYGTARNEIKKEAYRFDTTPPVMEKMPYYPDKEVPMQTMPYYPEEDSLISIPMSGRSPEEYKTFRETPYEKRSYKDGGEIRIEKGHNYIKDLIK